VDFTLVLRHSMEEERKGGDQGDFKWNPLISYNVSVSYKCAALFRMVFKTWYGMKLIAPILKETELKDASQFFALQKCQLQMFEPFT
jgi:hypothetical protein